MRYVLFGFVFVIATSCIVDGQDARGARPSKDVMPIDSSRLGAAEKRVSWEAFVPVFSELEASIERLRSPSLRKPFAARPDLFINVTQASESLARIAQHGSYLRGRWQEAKTGRPPEEYLTSLELNTALLKSIGRQSFTKNEALTVLQDVEDDLQTKAADCRNSKTGWANLIEVLVHTKQDSQRVDGYQVWFVPKGWAKFPEKWQRFSRESSPAAKGLPPGRYMMRLKKTSQTEAEPVTVGGEGKTVQEVDMRVP